MLTYALILIIMALMGFWLWYEVKTAPGGWECQHCGEDVVGLDFCPYCQHKRGE